MKKLLMLTVLLIVLPGCTKDARIKRAAALTNTKMQVEAAEYEAAATLEKKKEIADHHFKTMPKFTQVIDDYLQGRKPQEPTLDEVKDSE